MDSVIIIGGSARLPQAEEDALNALLARHSTFDGVQLYKLAWAADGSGIEKKHRPGCDQKTPFDWRCDCPVADLNHVPLCFHTNQQSYHLLSWQPPCPELSAYETACHEDFAKGTWTCIMHFLDAKGEAVRPTSTIMEKIIPILMQMREIDMAARRGFDATVKRERAKRKEAHELSQAKEDLKYQEHAERILSDTMHHQHDGNVKVSDSESLIVAP
jgi:hypothetical protein